VPTCPWPGSLTDKTDPENHWFWGLSAANRPQSDIELDGAAEHFSEGAVATLAAVRQVPKGREALKPRL
jgi:hypothetical protein